MDGGGDHGNCVNKKKKKPISLKSVSGGCQNCENNKKIKTKKSTKKQRSNKSLNEEFVDYVDSMNDSNSIDHESGSDTSNEIFFSQLESLSKKELSEKKEDIEFRELKELLLKFEKNAPNISSDFDISGYDDLIESSNNNIKLESESGKSYNILVALAGQLPRVINLYLYAYLIMTFF